MHSSYTVCLFLALLSTTTDGSAIKGASVWYHAGVQIAVTAMGCSWVYGWCPTPNATYVFDDGVPCNVEFVPMTEIGALTVNDTGIQPGSKHVLMWNEPDVNSFSRQSAAAAWPALYQGLSNNGSTLVGSPAPANTNLRPGDWFYDFMLDINNQVDFIALHRYEYRFSDVPGSVTDLKDYIMSVYNMYQKPIWLTELAMVDYSNWPNFSVPSDEVQQQFMIQACAMLEQLATRGVVERYSWFAIPPSPAQPATNLISEDGTLNALGRTYKAI